MFRQDNTVFYFFVPEVSLPADTNKWELDLLINDPLIKGADRAAVQESVRNTVTAIASEALSGETEYARAAKAYDGVAASAEYKCDENDEALINDLTSTVAGVKDGELICEGYSCLYKTVMNYMDMPCRIVSSNVIEHVWNIIYLEGKYYYADVTWDDEGDYAGYGYFAKGRATFDKDHFISGEDPLFWTEGLPEVSEEDF